MNDKKLLIPFVFFFAVLPTTGLTNEAEKDGDAPSIELLEFLADFETEDGQWMGPSALEEIIETGWSGNDPSGNNLEVTNDE